MKIEQDSYNWIFNIERARELLEELDKFLASVPQELERIKSIQSAITYEVKRAVAKATNGCVCDSIIFGHLWDCPQNPIR